MSKLAHSNQETMDEIEQRARDRAELVERTEAPDPREVLPEMVRALEAVANWYTPPNDSQPFPIKIVANALAAGRAANQ